MKRLALIAVTLSTAVVAAFGLWAVRAARAGFIQTGAGPYDYNDTANWADTDADFLGNIDGNWLNTLTLDDNQVVTFAADTVLDHGWTFECGGAKTLTLKGVGGNRLVTLGGDVAFDRGKGVTIGSGANGTRLNVDLGADRVFTIAGSLTKTPEFKDVVSGAYNLEKRGAGEVYFSNTANAFGGPGKTVTITGGTVAFNQSGANDSLGNSNNTVTLNGGTLKNRSNNATTSRNIVVTANDGTIRADYSGNAGYNAWSGQITGPGSLTVAHQSNTNRFCNLTNSENTFGGAGETVTIASCGLVLGPDGVFGNASNTLVLSSGALMNNSSSGTYTLGRTITGTSGNVFLNTGDGSKLVVPSDIPGTGNITINYTWQYKRGGYGAAGVPSYVPPGENAVVELQGDDTYTGTTTVAQGTLLRNSTHTGAGNYTVQAAQTLYPGQAYEEQIPAGKLGGNGTITFASGKKLTVAGILSPGMSIGTLRVVGDAVYSGTAGVFEVDVGPLNMSDLLDVSGLFDLNGSDGTAEAELRVLNPEEGTFTIANYGTLGGTFASVTGVGGFLYDINYGSGSGDHIVLTLLALPEPATLGLMALGGAALVVVRRRKRR